MFEGRIFPVPEVSKERAALRRATDRGTALAAIPLPACQCSTCADDHGHGECGACAFNRLMLRVGGIDQILAWAPEK